MGFRNLVPGRVVSVQGEQVLVDVDGVRLPATRRTALQPGDGAMLAIRPDDLVHEPGGADTLPATAVSSEFRGNDYTGFARMADGTELVFTAHEAVAPGMTLHLAAQAARTLAYPAA